MIKTDYRKDCVKDKVRTPVWRSAWKSVDNSVGDSVLHSFYWGYSAGNTNRYLEIKNSVFHTITKL